MATGRHARSGDHQRHAGGPSRKLILNHSPRSPKHVPVVGTEDDDRVVEHAGALERVDQFADLVVEIGRCSRSNRGATGAPAPGWISKES